LAALAQDLKNLSVHAEAQAPSDVTIATIMAAIDQIDIDFAKTALNKSKNQGLRAFAQQVIADHMAIQKSIQDVTQKLNLKPAGTYTRDWLNNQSDKVKDKLISSNGKSLDKYYVADEIQFSQTIATMIADTLLPNAQNPDLKAVLANAQPVMLVQLNAAQKLVPVVDPTQKEDGP
jgi:putative membrane protein